MRGANFQFAHPLSVNGSRWLRGWACRWQLPPFSSLIGVGFVDGRISLAATIVNGPRGPRLWRLALVENPPSNG